MKEANDGPIMPGTDGHVGPVGRPDQRRKRGVSLGETFRRAAANQERKVCVSSYVSITANLCVGDTTVVHPSPHFSVPPRRPRAHPSLAVSIALHPCHAPRTTFHRSRVSQRFYDTSVWFVGFLCCFVLQRPFLSFAHRPALADSPPLRRCT